MTASAEPAVLMRLETSDETVGRESSEPFCECEAARDTDDIAESIEEVRGPSLPSGRRDEPTRGGKTVDRGDGGDEWPRGLVSGNGDETFRS